MARRSHTRKKRNAKHETQNRESKYERNNLKRKQGEKDRKNTFEWNQSGRQHQIIEKEIGMREKTKKGLLGGGTLVCGGGKLGLQFVLRCMRLYFLLFPCCSCRPRYCFYVAAPVTYDVRRLGGRGDRRTRHEDGAIEIALGGGNII